MKIICELFGHKKELRRSIRFTADDFIYAWIKTERRCKRCDLIREEYTYSFPVKIEDWTKIKEDWTEIKEYCSYLNLKID